METKKRDHQGADEENVLGECEETTGMQTEEAPFITMETSDGVNSTNTILPTTPWWVYHPLYVKPPWWLDIQTNLIAKKRRISTSVISP